MVDAVITATSFEERTAAPRPRAPVTPTRSLSASGQAGGGRFKRCGRRRYGPRGDASPRHAFAVRRPGHPRGFHHLTRRDRLLRGRDRVGIRRDGARRARGRRPRVGPPVMGRGQCLRPHDPSNGLKFDYRRLARGNDRGCGMALPAPGASAIRSETTGDFSGTTPRKVPPRSWPPGHLAAWPGPSDAVGAAASVQAREHARSVGPVVRGNGLRRRALPSARSPTRNTLSASLTIRRCPPPSARARGAARRC